MVEVSGSRRIDPSLQEILLDQLPKESPIPSSPLPLFLTPVVRFTLTHLGYETKHSFETPTIISREEWGAAPMLHAAAATSYYNNSSTFTLNNTLRYIVIHHTGLSDITPQALQSFAQTRMGDDDLAYHFVIGRDGRIYEGRPIDIMGAHAGQSKEANDLAEAARKEISDPRKLKETIDSARRLDPDYGAIGIALSGSFMASNPTPEQLTSLETLLVYLTTAYAISKENIMGHSDVKAKIVENAGLTYASEETQCPGQMLADHLSGIISTLPAVHRMGDPLSQEKWIASVRFSLPPTSENVGSRLEWLERTYQKAIKIGDQEFAIHCQALAAVDASFLVKSELQNEAFRNLVQPLGIYLPTLNTDLRAGARYSNTIGHIGALMVQPKATAKKIAANLGDSSPITTNGNAVDLPESDQLLAFGLRQFDLPVEIIGEDGTPEKTLVGTMVMVPANLYVSAKYEVKYSTAEELSEGFSLVFASANYFAGYGQDMAYPTTLSISGGQPANLFISPSMNGLVIIEKGKLRIVNSNDIDLVLLVENTIGSSNSVFQSNLLVNNGQNQVSPDAPQKRDVRRVLAAFADGSYAIINFSKHLTLFETATIVAQIPNVTNAVNLDTGGGNMGGVILEDGQLAYLGSPNTHSQTVIRVVPTIYAEPRCIRGLCPGWK